MFTLSHSFLSKMTICFFYLPQHGSSAHEHSWLWGIDFFQSFQRFQAMEFMDQSVLLTLDVFWRGSTTKSNGVFVCMWDELSLQNIALSTKWLAPTEEKQWVLFPRDAQWWTLRSRGTWTKRQWVLFCYFLEFCFFTVSILLPVVWSCDQSTHQDSLENSHL